MKPFYPFCCSFLFAVLFKHVDSNIEYDAPQEIRLYQTVDPSPNAHWYENGVVTLQNINTGNVILTHPPNDEHFQPKLKHAAQKGGLYRLKSIVRTSKGKEIPFYSFVSAKSLADANNCLSVIVLLDQNGSVIGIKAYPEKKKSKASADINISFNKIVEQGPMPDTASYILKLEREREAKETGAMQDNRGFLAKYWMYLLPFVVFAVLSGSVGDPGQQQGQQAR